MPAKTPEAIQRKRKAAYERRKERLKTDPEFRRKEYDRKNAYRRKLDKEKRRKARELNPFKHSHPNYRAFTSCKRGAIKRGIEFNIEIDDIYIPEVCPIFGIPLFYTKGKTTDNTPSVDRLDNTKGYTKDNIWVISIRANKLKSDASFEEIEKLYFALKSREL